MEAIEKKNGLLKGILLFAVPLMLTSVLQLFFNTADVIVVGRYGGDTAAEREIALAAVGSCGALTNLILNFFMGLSIGTGVLVSQKLGAGDEKGVSPVMHTTFCLSLISGAILCAIGMVFAEPLLALMGTEADVLPEAAKYMRACFVGVPALTVYNFLSSGIRAAKDATRPLIFISVGGVANVVLNLVMVVVFRLGALGVGIATAASQWLSCALVLFYLFKADTPLRLSWEKMRIDRRSLLRILAIGIPSGLQSALFNITNVLLQSSVNTFGKTAVAGNAAAGNIDAYLYNIQYTIAQAAMTFVAFAYGKRDRKEAKRVVLVCCAIEVVVSQALGWLIVLCGSPLLGLFAPGNPEVIAYGLKRLYVMCPTYFLCGWMDTGTLSLRGIGQSALPTANTMIFACGFRVVWIFTVFAAFSENIMMLYMLYPVSYILTLTANFISFAVTVRKIPEKTEDPVPAT